MNNICLNVSVAMLNEQNQTTVARHENLKHTIDVTNYKITTTDLAALSITELLRKKNLQSGQLGQVVWIGECIDDYLYIDTAKTLLQKIGGKDDGEIHTYQFWRGNSGTIGTIKYISNYLMANPHINYSLIASGVSWENHSFDRELGPAKLVDAGGCILLSRSDKLNNVLGYVLENIDKYHMIYGFKYGGSKYPIDKSVVANGSFKVDILEKGILNDFFQELPLVAASVFYKCIKRAGLSIHDIDYLGIAGINKEYNAIFMDKLNLKTDIKVIEHSSCGFLGSIGPMLVLQKFMWDENIPDQSTMLLLSMGIDTNVEAILIKK